VLLLQDINLTKPAITESRLTDLRLAINILPHVLVVVDKGQARGNVQVEDNVQARDNAEVEDNAQVRDNAPAEDSVSNAVANE
jgi:hypothetical protein